MNRSTDSTETNRLLKRASQGDRSAVVSLLECHDAIYGGWLSCGWPRLSWPNRSFGRGAGDALGYQPATGKVLATAGGFFQTVVAEAGVGSIGPRPSRPFEDAQACCGAGGAADRSVVAGAGEELFAGTAQPYRGPASWSREFAASLPSFRKTIARSSCCGTLRSSATWRSRSSWELNPPRLASAMAGPCARFCQKLEELGMSGKA